MHRYKTLPVRLLERLGGDLIPSLLLRRRQALGELDHLLGRWLHLELL
jgi:hypothetical protein